LRLPALVAVALISLIGALGVSCALCSPVSAAEVYSDDAIKAAYLYRFAGYVKWPAGRDASLPFVIDVIGDEVVAGDLERLLPDHRINGHASQVHIIRRIADLGDAQMLYVGDGFSGDVRAALAAIADRPVLVVTDSAYGLDDGGTIHFVESNHHVRFEVSLIAAGRAGLQISSDLLSVAASVRGGHLRSRTDCDERRIAREGDLACSPSLLVRSVVPHPEDGQ